MTSIKLLIGRAIIVLAVILGGLWLGTQMVARDLAYQSRLGAPWLTILSFPLRRAHGSSALTTASSGTGSRGARHLESPDPAQWQVAPDQEPPEIDAEASRRAGPGYQTSVRPGV
jgi:hypothetical protein